MRPVAGPVVPLTVTPANSEELLGGASAQPLHGDVIANRVLVKGEPVPAPPGRADDFVWPLGSDGTAASAFAVAARRRPTPVARTERAPTAGQAAGEPKRAAAGKTAADDGCQAAHRAPGGSSRGRPPQSDVPRPPASIPRSDGIQRLAAVGAAQRGSVVEPIRNLSTACAAWRPSRIAHTTSDWPRRMSPAANTFGTDVA